MLIVLATKLWETFGDRFFKYFVSKLVTSFISCLAISFLSSSCLPSITDSTSIMTFSTAKKMIFFPSPSASRESVRNVMNSPSGLEKNSTILEIRMKDYFYYFFIRDNRRARVVQIKYSRLLTCFVVPCCSSANVYSGPPIVKCVYLWVFVRTRHRYVSACSASLCKSFASNVVTLVRVTAHAWAIFSFSSISSTVRRPFSTTMSFVRVLSGDRAYFAILHRVRSLHFALLP